MSIEPRIHQCTVRYAGDTWLEAEEFAYPNGGFTRRARVRMPDGRLRVVRCSLPDTFFSIPAKVDKRTGFLMTDEENVLEFHTRL